MFPIITIKLPSFSFFTKYPQFSLPLLNYSRDWIHETSIKEIKKPLPVKPACDFKPREPHKANSSPDDLVISTLFGQTKGIIPYIRTWSTTNSKATNVLLIDSKTNSLMENQSILNELEKDGIHVINVGDFNEPKPIPIGIFFVPSLEFVLHFGQHFKRIIILDGNDIVFQGDPFHKNYIWDSIGTFFEHYHIRRQGVNLRWIRTQRAWVKKWNLDSEQSNLGLVTGNFEKLSVLINIVFYIWGLPKYGPDTNDQGMYNYLVMNSYLRDAGVEYHTRIRNHLGIFRYFEKYRYGSFPDYHNFHSDDECMFVHYYGRDWASIISLRKLCHFGQEVVIKQR